ncbi:MAG: PilN domain-containing protein [Myxococcota bacterium]
MITINLLPVREAKKRETERMNAVVLGGVIGGTLLLILAVHLAISARVSSVNTQIQSTQAEIDELSKVIGDVAEFKRRKADIEEKLNVIQTLDANRGGPVRILDELATRLPEKIWLTSLTQSNGALTVEGLSIDNETIATYMTKIGESPFFTNVELERSQLEEGGPVKLNRFTITCLVTMPAAAAKGENSGA